MHVGDLIDVGQNIVHLEQETASLRTKLNRRLGKKTRAEAHSCPEYKKLAWDFHMENMRLHQARMDKIYLLKQREQSRM